MSSHLIQNERLSGEFVSTKQETTWVKNTPCDALPPRGTGWEPHTVRQAGRCMRANRAIRTLMAVGEVSDRMLLAELLANGQYAPVTSPLWQVSSSRASRLVWIQDVRWTALKWNLTISRVRSGHNGSASSHHIRGSHGRSSARCLRRNGAVGKVSHRVLLCLCCWTAG
jgi:hypothetical protein